MAERPSGSHGYSLQQQASAPGALPSQPQPTPQQLQQVAQQQQMASPVKDINAVNVCRIGQEMVHDIVSKAQEIFTSAKSMQVCRLLWFGPWG